MKSYKRKRASYSTNRSGFLAPQPVHIGSTVDIDENGTVVLGADEWSALQGHTVKHIYAKELSEKNQARWGASHASVVAFDGTHAAFAASFLSKKSSAIDDFSALPPDAKQVYSQQGPSAFHREYCRGGIANGSTANACSGLHSSLSKDVARAHVDLSPLIKDSSYEYRFVATPGMQLNVTSFLLPYLDGKIQADAPAYRINFTIMDMGRHGGRTAQNTDSAKGSHAVVQVFRIEWKD